jgi:small-conductance mechanosensitive channel/CRP-like cAMP-binding protein
LRAVVFAVFLDALWQAATTLRSLYILGALLLVAATARRMPVASRPSTRLPAVFYGLHVVLLVAYAAEIAAGWNARWTFAASEAFALLAAVQLALFLTFRLVAPLVGIHLPRILIDVFSAIAFGVSMIWVGQEAGLSVEGLITTSAVLTAVIGFALQDTLGNVMGGLALQVDRSVEVGDWISLGHGQPSGRVIEIRWRFTSLETRAWETVVVPNSLLMKGVVVVSGRRVGAPVQLRRHLDFYVDFRVAPGEVIDGVLDELRAAALPYVALDPAPQVLLVALKDSVAHYQVRYWLTDLATDEVADSDVRVRLVYGLRRRGIEPAIPAQAVFVTSDSDDRRARKAAQASGERRRAIAAVDLFATLDEPIQAALARELVEAPFTRGEAITREGDDSDSLYVIVSGRAVVQVGDGDDAREVARLGPGDFFGEMGLMTGERRSASVVAEGELRCFRIDKAALERALAAHPELADKLASVLASRRVRLEAARERGDDGQRVERAKQDLLARISRFFGRDG